MIDKILFILIILTLFALFHSHKSQASCVEEEGLFEIYQSDESSLSEKVALYMLEIAISSGAAAKSAIVSTGLFGETRMTFVSNKKPFLITAIPLNDSAKVYLFRFIKDVPKKKEHLKQGIGIEEWVKKELSKIPDSIFDYDSHTIVQMISCKVVK